MVESNISANEDNKFSVSLLAFWVKGSMSVDNNFLHIDMPNTVLFGLIPAGKRRENTPLQGVSQVETNSSFKLGAMIFGVLIALGGFSEMKSSGIGGLILALIGILMFLSGIKTQLSFERNGVRQSIDVPFFEGSKVREFADKVTQTLSGYQIDRNVRIQNTKQTQDLNAQSVANTQAIVNAMQNNNSVPQNQQVVNTPVNNTQAQPSASIPNPAPDAQVDSSTGSDTNMTSQFCPNCGAQNDASSSFCTSCGTKLN